MVQSISTGTFCEAKWLVDPVVSQGTHTTIQAAITAAAAAGGSQTVFIRPGTYTENLTLSANVNLTAYNCDGLVRDFISTPAGNVTIVGKATASYEGRVAISGIIFSTNSDFAFLVTGANSELAITNCYLNASNNTFISMSNGKMSLCYCFGNLLTTGIAWFAQTGGGLSFQYCELNNSGGSVTASTNASAGSSVFYSIFQNPVTTSGSGAHDSQYSSYFVLNTAIITTAGTGGCQFDYCIFESGSASAISVGAATTVIIRNCEVSSSNANAITGAGTINYYGTVFTSTSTTLNTTTQTGFQIPKSVGTSGQVLTSNGAGLISTFQSVPSSSTLVFIAQSVISNGDTAKTITSIPAYAKYWVTVDSARPQTDGANLICRYSVDNGSNYIATNYTSGSNWNGYNSAVLVNVNTTTSFILAPNVDTGTPGVAGGFYLYNTTNNLICMQGSCLFVNDTTAITSFANSVGSNTGFASFNALQFLWSTGNFVSTAASTITLYGIKES